MVPSHACFFLFSWHNFLRRGTALAADGGITVLAAFRAIFAVPLRRSELMRELCLLVPEQYFGFKMQALVVIRGVILHGEDLLEPLRAAITVYNRIFCDQGTWTLHMGCD